MNHVVHQKVGEGCEPKQDSKVSERCEPFGSSKSVQDV